MVRRFLPDTAQQHDRSAQTARCLTFRTDTLTRRLYIIAARAGTGYGNGHLYKATDGGASWAVSDTGVATAPDRSVRAIAIDPRNPSTLFTAVNGILYKSDDRAATWKPVGSVSELIQSIVIDPATAGTIYTVPADGLFKSTDGGLTWREIDSGLSRFSMGGLPVSAFAIDPFAPQTLYAVTFAYLFKSTDGGAHWTQLTQAPGEFCGAGARLRRPLAGQRRDSAGHARRRAGGRRLLGRHGEQRSHRCDSLSRF